MLALLVTFAMACQSAVFVAVLCLLPEACFKEQTL